MGAAEENGCEQVGVRLVLAGVSTGGGTGVGVVSRWMFVEGVSECWGRDGMGAVWLGKV